MSIDWFTFAAQIVNFVVLVALLNHFLYRPISEAIANREANISKRLAAAAQRESEAEALQQKFENSNREMEISRQTMLDDAQEQAEQTKMRLMQEVRDEVQHRRTDWMESLRREQESLLKLVNQKAGEQITSISGKVLRQIADQNLEQQTLTVFLREIKNISDAEREQLMRESSASGPPRIFTAFSISDERKQEIQRQLQAQFGWDHVQFDVSEEIVLGVELRVGGVKIGWSVQEFLESLSDEFQHLWGK